MCVHRVRIVYRYFSIALFVVGASLFSQATFSRDYSERCPDLFRKIYLDLRPNIGSPALLKGFETDDVRLLGSGYGGHVYRVIPKDFSPPFVVKVYDIGGPTVARKDRIAFSILDQVLNSDAKDGTLKSIKILEPLDERTLKLEYVAGRDIEDVSWSAGSDRTRLLRLFYRQLQEAKRKLDAHSTYKTEDGEFMIKSSVLRKDGYEGKPMLLVELVNVDPTAKPVKLYIALKSDGVALTPSGQFVIIDPS